MEDYEQARGLPSTELGDLQKFMAATTNFGKSYKTITQVLFKELPAKPKEYAAVAHSAFGSPFFRALSEYCKQEQGAEHFIHRVLGVSLADAKALSGELRA